MHIRKLPFEKEKDGPQSVTHWSIFAISDHEGQSQVEKFLLEQLNGGSIAQATELLAFLDSLVIDEEGPRRWIGTSRCHESVADAGIYEFRQGRLRVHWFYGQGRCVAILARAVLKSSPKTPKPLAKELKRLKSEYEVAVENSTLIVVEE